MSVDLSRLTFQPWKDFVGVIMQQGRVQLDADWNEWVAELARRLQAGTMDTLGPAEAGRAVVPSTTPSGFEITALAGDAEHRGRAASTSTASWSRTTAARPMSGIPGSPS